MIDVEHIAEHLYTKGQPDPDLVIRTSGEQRLGRVPALAERGRGRPTSARPTGRTFGASTSCARSGPMPSASVGSASEPSRRRGAADGRGGRAGAFTPASGVSLEIGLAASIRRNGKWGSPPYREARS